MRENLTTNARNEILMMKVEILLCKKEDEIIELFW